MKKFLTLLMALVMTFSFGAMASACNDKDGGASSPADSSTPADGSTPDDGGNEDLGEGEVTEQEWMAAISDISLANVTIVQTASGTIQTSTVVPDQGLQTTTMEATQTRTIKFTEAAVWVHEQAAYVDTATNMGADIDESMYILNEEDSDYFEVKSLYSDMFLGILAEKDSFVYNADLGAYEIKETITLTFGRDAATVTEQINSGKAIFDANGVLISFSCALVESITTTDSIGIVQSTETLDIAWAFSNYGTTVITQAEIDAANESNN